MGISMKHLFAYLIAWFDFAGSTREERLEKIRTLSSSLGFVFMVLVALLKYPYTPEYARIVACVIGFLFGTTGVMVILLKEAPVFIIPIRGFPAIIIGGFLVSVSSVIIIYMIMTI